MALADRFMEIARSMVPEVLFQRILAAAVAAERRRIEAAPAFRADERLDKPTVVAGIAAGLDGCSPPPVDKAEAHAAQRLRERVDPAFGANELTELQRLVRDGGPHVRIVRTRMEAVRECEVTFRGREFVVIYNASRERLVTAYVRRAKHRRRGKRPPPSAPEDGA